MDSGIDALLAWASINQGAQRLVGCRSIPGAGRGIFAEEDIPAHTPLFTIPGHILLNRFTLGITYPGHETELSSVQLITLHLALHRHDSSDQFSPFISSLPPDFEGHPLTWSVAPNSAVNRELLKFMPATSLWQLKNLEARFWKDVDAVRIYFSTHESKGFTSPWVGNTKSSELADLLWAWLNVNTRCIYLPVGKGPSSLVEDLTMCPFVDFANHIGDAQQSCEFKPIYTQPIRPGTSPSPPHSITFSSPPVNLKKGDEIFLRYGYHSNTTLFCEYGFVLPRPDWAEGDLQLDFLLGPQFQSYPEFKVLLEKWGYWEDWTVHNQPAPAHPSYRLLVALRLLSTVTLSESEADWEAMVLGYSDAVSPQNEKDVRATLLKFCLPILEQSRVMCKALQASPLLQQVSEADSWVHYAISCLESLHREAAQVATHMIESVNQGHEW